MTNAAFSEIETNDGIFVEFELGHNKLDNYKHWWPKAEDIVGFFYAYQLTGNTIFA